MSTWLDDMRVADPELAAAWEVVGNQDKDTLRCMVKALTSMPFLNTAEDDRRLAAARYILERKVKQ